MSKSKKIAVEKNLLNYMRSNVSEITGRNKLAKGTHCVPLKFFYLDYKEHLVLQKLSPLTYTAFRCEFDKILKYLYPSAQIVKREGKYLVLNLVQSTLIEPKNTSEEDLTE